MLNACIYDSKLNEIEPIIVKDVTSNSHLNPRKRHRISRLKIKINKILHFLCNK